LTAVTDACAKPTCASSSALRGADVISAFADTNGNTTQEADEPGDTATKTWVLAGSTEGCKVTYGGRIIAANGDTATLGGNAKAAGPKGQEEFQDHGPAVDMNVHSIDVQAVLCSADGLSASIFGTATIDGTRSVPYTRAATHP